MLQIFGTQVKRHHGIIRNIQNLLFHYSSFSPDESFRIPSFPNSFTPERDVSESYTPGGRIPGPIAPNTPQLFPLPILNAMAGMISVPFW